MADFSALKTAIQANIRTNGNEEITGAILQDILLSMVTMMGDGAINSLAEALAAEVTARQNAVGAEKQERQQEDSSLSGRINAEAQARAEADTQLGNSITAITTRLNEGYIYAGIATPSTNPGTPAGKVFYIALQAGTYTNFSSLTVTQGINILKCNGTAWSQEQLVAIDDVPTAGSNNLVKSGGVYEKMAPILENSNQYGLDYSEFLEVKVDFAKKILTGILKDGSLYIRKIKVDDYSNIINHNFSECIKDQDDTPFFLDANVDKSGKVIEATMLDGTKYFHSIKSPSIDAIKQRRLVLLDTDLGADSDDFIELAILCLAAQKGLINLIGVNLTKWHAGSGYTSATAVDAICSYYGIKNICVGKSSFIETVENQACKAASDFQSHTYSVDSQLETSLDFYKRTLLSLPNGQKCDIVIGGFLTGLGDLLDYIPSDNDDESADVSKWSGIKIVKEKVDKVYIIGGYYPNSTTKEWNFSANGNSIAINATHSVLSKCPRPLKFLGIGSSVATLNAGGFSLYENQYSWSILYQALYAFAKAKAGSGATEEQIANYWRTHRCPWGAVIALIVADDNLELSGYTETFGVNVIDTDKESATYGCNTFTPSIFAKDSYLIIKNEQIGRIEHRIDQLILEDNYIGTEDINNFKIERI